MIRDYQAAFECRLVVLIDTLFPHSITAFEETVHDADPRVDLHIMLSTPGGDGETAIRLLRQAQSCCKELTIIVPDQAKSAGTLLALGAHRILMGRTSDLGPIDPQFSMSDGSLVPAKAIISAVEHAENAIREQPTTYEFHVAMLSEVNGVMVQQARDAIEHSDVLLQTAIACHPGRELQDVAQLAEQLRDPLIGEPRSHAATISAADAQGYGLPVVQLDAACEQWNKIWHLWVRYSERRSARIYESEHTSQFYKFD